MENNTTHIYKRGPDYLEFSKLYKQECRSFREAVETAASGLKTIAVASGGNMEGASSYPIPHSVLPIMSGDEGTNGPIGYLSTGEMVEWVIDEDEVWPILLLRSKAGILAAYRDIWDQVWWDRKQDMFRNIKEGTEPSLDPYDMSRIKEACRKIEEKFGLENLQAEQPGVRFGKLCALQWVLGTPWDETGDT